VAESLASAISSGNAAAAAKAAAAAYAAGSTGVAEALAKVPACFSSSLSHASMGFPVYFSRVPKRFLELPRRVVYEGRCCVSSAHVQLSWPLCSPLLSSLHGLLV
jgi:hypothetical protein